MPTSSSKAPPASRLARAVSDLVDDFCEAAFDARDFFAGVAAVAMVVGFILLAMFRMAA